MNTIKHFKTMNNNTLKINIITAISYSKLISNTLSIGECICLHQWHTQGIEPNTLLKKKYEKLLKLITQQNWKRPEQHYDEGMQLYYKCPNTQTWQEVTNHQL